MYGIRTIPTYPPRSALRCLKPGDDPLADLRRRQLRVATGGQVLLDGLVDTCRRVGVTDMRQKQGHGCDRGGGVSDTLTRDVWCASVHWLEHRRIRAGRVDIAAGRQPDTPGHRGGQIGDDVAEQVVGDD